MRYDTFPHGRCFPEHSHPQFITHAIAVLPSLACKIVCTQASDSEVAIEICILSASVIHRSSDSFSASFALVHEARPQILLSLSMA